MANDPTTPPADPFKWVTPEARLSYPNLFQPRAQEGQKAKYGCALIFPKSSLTLPAKTPAMKQAEAAVIAAAKKGLGDAKAIAMLKEKKLRLPFRDGAEKFTIDASGKKVYPIGYGPDVIFVNVRADRMPGVVDQALKAMTENDPRIYAGCYVRASIQAFYYDTNGNQGVSFGLMNVQLLRDGEPLGGMSRPENDFEPVAAPLADDDDLLGGASTAELTDADLDL